ncbi:glycosyltransferase [Acrocarpospora macrocephala]|uniref:Glycosyl transferase n=1 Tax=Acrocarpospora macrocephala TaxID=150177 RepID=A0A5M3WV33_9ACTN|nr:glycosyltransferase [Acrocarpospora macrocephala]GES09998.1 glycosyl transferase [Acrocarpospora macrocephala]
MPGGDDEAAELRRRLEREIYRADYAKWQLESTRRRRWYRLAAAGGAARKRQLRNSARMVFGALRPLPPLAPPTRISIPAPPPRPPEPEPSLLPDIPEIEFPAGMVNRPGLRVATILDTFSALALSYEWTQIGDFGPDDWREVLTREKPDLLFVESAWRGNDFRWRFLIRTEPKQPLIDLVAWCREQGIPTVFWNKEDPPNYDVFLKAAKLFDHVFTVDEECLAQYREDLGHDRVGLMPFGAQPRIHNPIRVDGHGSLEVVFAGTYFAARHPERQEQMDAVVAPAIDHGLHIYSRREPGDKLYDFPPEYVPSIVGMLPYEKMLAAQKLYKVILNVNTVVDSPTMCARRVFEVSATGTPLVSGYAKAIREIFGELIPMSGGREETRALLRTLLRSAELRDRVGHLAMREVLTAHTYRHRIDSVLRELGRDVPERRRPEVTVVAAVDGPAQLDRVVASVAAQTLRPTRLVLVASGPDEAALGRRAAQAGVDQVLVLPAGPTDSARLVREAAVGDYMAPFAPTARYGRHFLADLLMAFDYTEAGIVGKRAYYTHHTPSAANLIVNPADEHRYVSDLNPAAMLVSTQALRDLPAGGEDLFADCAQAGIRIYAADRFGFVEIDDLGSAWGLDRQDAALSFYGPPDDHVMI